MNKKIKILIATSIVVLIFFALIQAYLISNTYEIKKRGFINETRSSISRMDDYSPVLDSVNDIWQEYFIDLLEDYNDNIGPNNSISIEDRLKAKDELLKKLLLKTDSINDSYKNLYARELAKKDLDFELKFHKRVEQIIIKDSLYSDTIFSKEKSETFRLIGDKFAFDEGHKISSSLWLTENDYEINVEGKIVEKSFYI